MNLHWLCWQPTPYNEFLFQNLARTLPLKVHYREEVRPSHPWATAFGRGYRCRYYRKRLGVDWHVVRLALEERRSVCVVGGWDHPTAWLLLSLLRVLRRPYALWTDTPNLGQRRHPLKGWLRRVWLKWIFDGAAHVLGTGVPALAALEVMGAEREKLVNFPYFVDLEAYHPEGKNPPNGKDEPIRVLSVGRVDNARKGHDLAVRAVAVAAERCPGVRWNYEIAGTGPDVRVVEGLACALGLVDRVRVLGWIEPRELTGVYRRAHVLIHASPAHDAFGNAILEGMASGLAVLASDVCGAAQDRIQHGVNGLIHRAGNVSELGNQLVGLFREPERIRELGQRARETAEQWPVEKGGRVISDMWRFLRDSAGTTRL